MGLTLLFGGGGSLNPSATDSGAATDGVLALERSAYTDAGTGSGALVAMAFTMQDSAAGTEAASGGASPNQAVSGVDGPAAITETINLFEPAFADANLRITETAVVSFGILDFVVSDQGFAGENAHVTDISGPNSSGGLFNETIRRDRELWNRRFQPGRAV
jgi:hypothetical protein